MTAADSLMVNGYGNLFMDPAWQQYWALSQQMNGQNYAQQLAALQSAQGTANTTGTTATRTSSPSFQGAIARAEEPKKGGNGAAIALTATAAVGGTALWIASRGKAAGAKGLWNQLSAGFKSLGRSTKNAAQIQARQVNGKWVYTLPEKNQVLRGADLTKSDSLGLTVKNGLKWTDEGAKVKGYHIFVKGKDGTWNRITVRDNEVVACTNMTKKAGDTGRSFIENWRNGTVRAEDEVLANNIEAAMRAVVKKDLKGLNKEIKISNIVYGQEVDGAKALSIAKNGHWVKEGKFMKAKQEDGLRVINTNRFEAASDTVAALRHDNPKFAEAYDAMTRTKKPAYDAWNIASAKYTPGSSLPNTEIVIENGAIKGINKTVNGKEVFYGVEDDTYKAVYMNNKKIFDNVFKHQKDFTDIVRTMA